MKIIDPTIVTTSTGTGTNTISSNWYTTSTTPINVPLYTTNTITISDVLNKNNNELGEYIGKIVKENMNNITIKEDKITIKGWSDVIKDIKEIIPGKIYLFTFEDGEKVKTICQENDEFDLRYACFLAIAKKKYKKQLTFEGILEETKKLSYSLEWNKRVNKYIKNFVKKQEEEKEKEKKEAETKEIRKRKIAKKIAKKERQKEAKKQEEIDTIVEAIRQAKYMI